MKKELTQEEINKKNLLKKKIWYWTKRILIAIFCVAIILLMIIGLLASAVK